MRSFAASVCSVPRAALRAALCESADAEQADLDGRFTEPQHLTSTLRRGAITAWPSHQACPILP